MNADNHRPCAGELFCPEKVTAPERWCPSCRAAGWGNQCKSCGAHAGPSHRCRSVDAPEVVDTTDHDQPCEGWATCARKVTRPERWCASCREDGWSNQCEFCGAPGAAPYCPGCRDVALETDATASR